MRLDLRDVPDSTGLILKDMASARGMSLPEFIKEQLRLIAHYPETYDIQRTWEQAASATRLLLEENLRVLKSVKEKL